MRLFCARTFGRNPRSGFTISYTHQFGSRGGGFQFPRFLKFSRGKIRGRVFVDLNGNGVLDAAEPGVANMKIQLDGKKAVTTDKDGRYETAASEGRHTVALTSDELGVRLLASSQTEAGIVLGSGQKLELNFGVRDFGSISGRVFNDIDPNTPTSNQSSPGVGGVQVILRPVDAGSVSFPLEQITRPNGQYDFRDLRPGKYMVEIVPGSLPANFLIPKFTSSTMMVHPLNTFYYYVPVTAQRAVTGVVFIDKNGDGKYSIEIDQAVANATVSAGNVSTVTDANGQYLLRKLPARGISLMVTLRTTTTTFFIELGAQPTTRRGFDLVIDPK